MNGGQYHGSSQAVSSVLVIAKARVQFKGSLCETCGGRSGKKIGIWCEHFRFIVRIIILSMYRIQCAVSACVELAVCRGVPQTLLTLGAIAGVRKISGGMHESDKVRVVHVLVLWSCWMLTDNSRKCKSYYTSNISCLAF